jgi:hypothetical protein
MVGLIAALWGGRGRIGPLCELFIFFRFLFWWCLNPHPCRMPFLAVGQGHRPVAGDQFSETFAYL